MKITDAMVELADYEVVALVSIDKREVDGKPQFNFERVGVAFQRVEGDTIVIGPVLSEDIPFPIFLYPTKSEPKKKKEREHAEHAEQNSPSL